MGLVWSLAVSKVEQISDPYRSFEIEMDFITNKRWSEGGGQDQRRLNFMGLGDKFRRFWRASNGDRCFGLFDVSTRFRSWNDEEEELIASQLHTEWCKCETPCD